MKRIAIGAGSALLALALSACGSSSSSSSTTPTPTPTPSICPIPAYTLVAASPPTYTAVVNSDCSVTTSGGGHIHMLFTAPATGNTTTMTVSARFDSNGGQIYLLFYGTTPPGDGTGGWIVQHDFSTGTPSLNLSICYFDTSGCTPQFPASYGRAYVLGTFYPLTVQVTKTSGGDTFKAWADTAYLPTAPGDKSGQLSQTTTGNLMGIHVINATVKSVTIQ